MEVDTKASVGEDEPEEELLYEEGDGGEDAQEFQDDGTEFTSGDVELLLGDDDVHAFADESFESKEEEDGGGVGGDADDSVEETAVAKLETDNSSDGSNKSSSYVPRSRGRGRPYFVYRGMRGMRPPPPYAFFPPRPRGGLRPPFPGAIRPPPPFAFRGRGPPNFFRHPRPPRGAFMRGMRPPHYHHHHEQEQEEEEEEEATVEDDGGGEAGGPKPLMSIRTPKDVKENVQATIFRGRGGQSAPHAAPLGMGMGPRYHGVMRGGMRPPPPPDAAEVRGGRGGPRPRLLSTRPPRGAGSYPPSSRGDGGRGLPRGGRGRGRGIGDDSMGVRPSLKRPHPSSYGGNNSYDNNYNSGAPRPKMMSYGGSTRYPTTASSYNSGSTLRSIHTTDEPMQTGGPPPPPTGSRGAYFRPRTPGGYNPNPRYQQPTTPTRGGYRPRGTFTVTHNTAPALTQVTMVAEQQQQRRSLPQPVSANPNLRSIPMAAAPGSDASASSSHKITKAGGTSSRVMISNLPISMSFERISAMTTACGSVRTININDGGSAIVEFVNPSMAENFIRANNRKSIDGSTITVSRLA